MTAVPDSFEKSPHKAPSGLTFALHWHYCRIFHGERTETMSEPHYDRMSKKALIDRLLKAERQLRAVGAEKEPVRAPAAGGRAGKKSVSENRLDPASVRKEAKSARSARPAGADIKSASESDYTILDRDGQIRKLYKVVKDIRDDKGNSVFSEGALYEISSKPGTTSGVDHPDHPGESDRTELIC